MKQYRFLDKEIKNLIKSMIILVDSRKKKHDHILNYLTKQGIAYRLQR